MGFLQAFDSLLGDSVRLSRILRKEMENRRHIYMYLVDDTWVSFQRSAYLLRRLCPSSTEAALQVNGCPYPIVAAFVKSSTLKISSAHIDCRESGYRVRVYGTDLDTSGYGKWMEALTSEMSRLT